jgi:transcriptional regulator with PAS, ATPase and Fis domain
MKKKRQMKTVVDFYETIRSVLSKHNKPYNKEEIKLEIKKAIEPFQFQYMPFIRVYLVHALEIGDSEAKDAFYDIFYEDFKEYDLTLFCNCILKFEGLLDIPELDLAKSILEMVTTADKKSEAIETLLSVEFSSLYPSERVMEIFSHSQHELPLLIIGETGTSKEAVARAIHKLSDRKDKQFIEINCAAIPENLLEDELFGHLEGAFTGATNFKKGLFEEADTGTIFLDEIGKMHKPLQAKLLKALEEKKVRRIGGHEITKIDVRFIAAAQPSNIDNEEILPDLVYRLGYPDIIKMPTLNERLNETPVASHKIVIGSALKMVLQKMNIKEKISIKDSCYDSFKSYDYRGNFRELENILRGAVRKAINNKRKEILSEDLYHLKGGLSQEQLPEKSGVCYESIKLKDIVSYVEDMKLSIVNNKLKDVIATGKDIKSVLIEEGLPKEKYYNYYKKLTNIIGKGIRDIKKTSSN